MTISIANKSSIATDKTTGFTLNVPITVDDSTMVLDATYDGTGSHSFSVSPFSALQGNFNLYVNGSDNVHRRVVLNLAKDSVYAASVTAVKDISLDTAQSQYGASFSSDGLHFYISSSSPSDVLLHYTLSVAWDVSTATFSESKALGFTEPNTSFSISPDGKKMIFGHTGNVIREWTLGTAYLLSTASYTYLWNSTTGNHQSAIYTGDGYGIVTYNSIGGYYEHFNLTIAYDLSTVVEPYAKRFAYSQNAYSLHFSHDGKFLHNYISQFELGTPYDIDSLITGYNKYYSLYPSNVLPTALGYTHVNNQDKFVIFYAGDLYEGSRTATSFDFVVAGGSEEYIGSAFELTGADNATFDYSNYNLGTSNTPTTSSYNIMDDTDFALSSFSIDNSQLPVTFNPPLASELSLETTSGGAGSVSLSIGSFTGNNPGATTLTASGSDDWIGIHFWIKEPAVEIPISVTASLSINAVINVIIQDPDRASLLGTGSMEADGIHGKGGSCLIEATLAKMTALHPLKVLAYRFENHVDEDTLDWVTSENTPVVYRDDFYWGKNDSSNGIETHAQIFTSRLRFLVKNTSDYAVDFKPVIKCLSPNNTSRTWLPPELMYYSDFSSTQNYTQLGLSFNFSVTALFQSPVITSLDDRYENLVDTSHYLSGATPVVSTFKVPGTGQIRHMYTDTNYDVFTYYYDDVTKKYILEPVVPPAGLNPQEYERSGATLWHDDPNKAYLLSSVSNNNADIYSTVDGVNWVKETISVFKPYNIGTTKYINGKYYGLGWSSYTTCIISLFDSADNFSSTIISTFTVPGAGGNSRAFSLVTSPGESNVFYVLLIASDITTVGKVFARIDANNDTVTYTLMYVDNPAITNQQDSIGEGRSFHSAKIVDGIYIDQLQGIGLVPIIQVTECNITTMGCISKQREKMLSSDLDYFKDDIVSTNKRNGCNDEVNKYQGNFPAHIEVPFSATPSYRYSSLLYKRDGYNIPITIPPEDRYVYPSSWPNISQWYYRQFGGADYDSVGKTVRALMYNQYVTTGSDFNGLLHQTKALPSFVEPAPTKQKMGSGSYANVNLCKFDTGRCFDTTTLQPDEEVEVTIPVLIQSNTYDIAKRPLLELRIKLEDQNDQISGYLPKAGVFSNAASGTYSMTCSMRGNAKLVTALYPHPYTIMRGKGTINAKPFANYFFNAELKGTANVIKAIPKIDGLSMVHSSAFKNTIDVTYPVDLAKIDNIMYIYPSDLDYFTVEPYIGDTWGKLNVRWRIDNNTAFTKNLNLRLQIQIDDGTWDEIDVNAYPTAPIYMDNFSVPPPLDTFLDEDSSQNWWAYPHLNFKFEDTVNNTLELWFAQDANSVATSGQTFWMKYDRDLDTWTEYKKASLIPNRTFDDLNSGTASHKEYGTDRSVFAGYETHTSYPLLFAMTISDHDFHWSVTPVPPGIVNVAYLRSIQLVKAGDGSIFAFASYDNYENGVPNATHRNSFAEWNQTTHNLPTFSNFVPDTLDPLDTHLLAVFANPLVNDEIVVLMYDRINDDLYRAYFNTGTTTIGVPTLLGKAAAIGLNIINIWSFNLFPSAVDSLNVVHFATSMDHNNFTSVASWAFVASSKIFWMYNSNIYLATSLIGMSFEKNEEFLHYECPVQSVFFHKEYDSDVFYRMYRARVAWGDELIPDRDPQIITNTAMYWNEVGQKICYIGHKDDIPAGYINMNTSIYSAPYIWQQGNDVIQKLGGDSFLVNNKSLLGLRKYTGDFTLQPYQNIEIIAQIAMDRPWFEDRLTGAESNVKHHIKFRWVDDTENVLPRLGTDYFTLQLNPPIAHAGEADLKGFGFITAYGTKTSGGDGSQADLKGFGFITAYGTKSVIFDGEASFTMYTVVDESGSECFHGVLLYEPKMKMNLNVQDPIIITSPKIKLRGTGKLMLNTGKRPPSCTL